MPQHPTILPTTFAAGFHDVPTTVAAKFQRRMPQQRRSVQRGLPHGSTKRAAEMPQPPTTAAAGMPQLRPTGKPPQKLTRKRPLLEVGSLGNRRMVENFHVGCAAGRHWPSQVAIALWRRAAHRDCPPHDWPPVQSPFHLAAAAAPVLRLGSGASVVPAVSAISMPLFLI